MPHINRDYSICLWHIPRTAGTYLRDTLADSGIFMKSLVETHADVTDVGIQARAFKYHAVIIRESESWYRSIWEFLRTRPGTLVLAKWFGLMCQAERDDFERFREIYDGIYDRIVRSYTYEKTAILKTESIHADAQAWLTSIGIDKMLAADQQLTA